MRFTTRSWKMEKIMLSVLRLNHVPLYLCCFKFVLLISEEWVNLESLRFHHTLLGLCFKLSVCLTVILWVLNQITEAFQVKKHFQRSTFSVEPFNMGEGSEWIISCMFFFFCLVLRIKVMVAISHFCVFAVWTWYFLFLSVTVLCMSSDVITTQTPVIVNNNHLHVTVMFIFIYIISWKVLPDLNLCCYMSGGQCLKHTRLYNLIHFN